MTKTAKTDRALVRILESEGAPSEWTESEARAVWDAFNEKALFDGFEDFICALIVRARSPY